MFGKKKFSGDESALEICTKILKLKKSHPIDSKESGREWYEFCTRVEDYVKLVKKRARLAINERTNRS